MFFYHLNLVLGLCVLNKKKKRTILNDLHAFVRQWCHANLPLCSYCRFTARSKYLLRFLHFFLFLAHSLCFEPLRISEKTIKPLIFPYFGCVTSARLKNSSLSSDGIPAWLKVQWFSSVVMREMVFRRGLEAEAWVGPLVWLLIGTIRSRRLHRHWSAWHAFLFRGRPPFRSGFRPMPPTDSHGATGIWAAPTSVTEKVVYWEINARDKTARTST